MFFSNIRCRIIQCQSTRLISVVNLNTPCKGLLFIFYHHLSSLDLHQHKPLGMENGEILDKKITSSSQVDMIHAAIQGRLHFQATPGKAGSWSAGSEDSIPWLQVDLDIQNTRVTGVATQGRNGPFAQWVTEYKLQYSNDGVSFKYYREPGQTTVKVRT